MRRGCVRVLGLLFLVIIAPACGGGGKGGGGGGATPQVDTLAPALVVDLSASPLTSSSITVSWTAPGDDGMAGTAAAYDLRYSLAPITDANWASAQSVVGEPAPATAGTFQNMAVTGLSPSTLYYFALKTSDEVPNVSGLSNVASAFTSAAPDTTAPAAVSNLAVTSVGATSVTLQWSAPGDDGNVGTCAFYDVRYSATPIDTTNWAAATQATGEPAPFPAGSVETFTVTGLSPSTQYYFALKSSDEVANVSGLSNVVGALTSALPDTTAPAAVSNLAVTSVGATSVTLRWTAPGDDGNVGTATSYDLRYSAAPIDAANWAAATQATGEPAPSPAGSVETFTATGLPGDTVLYFALKSTDESANVSGLSNVPWTGVFSPFVAYVTNKTPGNAWALFTTNISGAFRVNLTQGLPYATDTNGFPFTPPYGYRWSPDGTKMLFLADTTTNSDAELYIVNSTGGAPLKLSPPLGPFGMVREFEWSPNGQWISMVLWNNSTITELWTVRPDGTQKQKVSGTPAGSTGVGFGDPSNPSCQWAPDSSRLLYLAEENTAGLAELYTVNPDGTARTKVSALTGFDIIQFRWSPNGTRIAYVSYSSPSPSIYDLYTTLPTTSAAAALITGSLRNNVLWNFRWAPDSSRIAYMVGNPGGVLWSSLPDGTGPLNLSGNAGVPMNSLEWAPDGSRIACAEAQLWTVLPATANSATAITALTGSETVRKWSWAPDSSRIAYSNQANSDYKAYTTLPTSSAGNVVITPSSFNPDFDEITWAPTSDRLAYVRLALYTTLPTTAAGHLAVSPPAVPGGGVGLSTHTWTVDGLKILYLGYMEQIGRADLYITDKDSSANNLRLSGPLDAVGYVSSYVRRP